MECIPYYSIQTKAKNTSFRFFVLAEWIASEELPEYKQFTEEPKAKRNRRHKKYAKEALEAEAAKKELSKKNQANSLEQQIMKRQSEREANSASFLDRLMEKYGGSDDSEEYFPAKKSKKSTAKKPNDKEPLKKVKNGRVTKKK